MEVHGDEHLQAITILDAARGEKATKPTNALFAFIDPFWLESSVPGIFVAGDVRHGSVKRVAAGVGEGATAVTFIHQFLRSGV